MHCYFKFMQNVKIEKIKTTTSCFACLYFHYNAIFVLFPFQILIFDFMSLSTVPFVFNGVCKWMELNYSEGKCALTQLPQNSDSIFSLSTSNTHCWNLRNSSFK